MKLATKMGMPYGVAAIVKGKGISTLKKYGIIMSLQTACSSSGEREGALFVIQVRTKFGKLYNICITLILFIIFYRGAM